MYRLALFCSILMAIAAGGCASEEPIDDIESAGQNGEGGGGGTGQGGTGQGGVAVNPECVAEFGFAECCEAADHLPCRNLPESECAKREYCSLVRGQAWSPSEEGGTGNEQTIGTGPQLFLGCKSECRGSVEEFTCTYSPSAPDECYLVPTTGIPDGWVALSACVDEAVQAGQCEPP